MKNNNITKEQLCILEGLAYWRVETTEARNSEGGEADAERAEINFFNLYADALELAIPMDAIRAVYIWASDRRAYLTEYTWQVVERAGYRIIAG